MGGGGDDSIDIKLPSSFSGYGYGGGGINVADFGGDYTRGLISAGFSPGNLVYQEPLLIIKQEVSLAQKALLL